MKVILLAVVVLTTAVLVSTADPECVNRRRRGLSLHWPNPADCSRYYRCTGRNVRRAITCPAGKEYNSRNGRCGNVGRGLCKLSLIAPLAQEDNICANENDGAYLEDTGHCRNFYICNNKSAFAQSCPSGSYFNATSTTCQPDSNLTCWQNFCVKQTNGTFLANPASCLSFYVCNDENVVSQTCESGSFFNTTAGNCQPDKEGVNCYENLCFQKSDGAFLADKNNCTNFYVCLNNRAVLQYCTDGSYFDADDLVCKPGDCPSGTTEPPTEIPTDITTTPEECSGETTTTPEECTGETTTTPSPEECTDETTTTPSPEECTGETTTTPSPEECTGETTSTPSPEECTDETTTTCQPDTTTSNECCDGEVSENPANCASYFQCVNGKLEERDCIAGSYFDETLKTCTQDVDNKCPQCQPETTTTATPSNGRNVRSRRSLVDIDESENCTCPGGYQEGTVLPNPTDCDKYYVCTNRSLVAQTCGQGNLFDGVTLTCIPDTENKCWPVENVNCTCPGGYQEGTIVPNPTDCDKYYVCTDRKLVAQTCGQGNLFDSVTLTCIPDTENKCWPVENVNCTCPGGYQEGTIVPNPTDCDKYYVCTDRTLVAQTCGQGNLFDSVTLTCIPDTENKCWPAENVDCTCPGGYQEGTLLPNPTDCDKYYICTNRTLVSQSCGVGNLFNAAVGTCQKDTRNTCWVCQNQQNGVMLPNPKECNGYYVCSNGQQVEGTCALGDWFNPSSRACETDLTGACYNPCACTTECIKLPHPNCQKYYQCSNGQMTIETCNQNEGFDAATGECSTSVVCQAECCAYAEDGTTFPVAGHDNEFYLCLNHQATIKICPENTLYNATLGICLAQPSCSCDQTKCANNSAGFSFPSLTDNNSTFCVCKDGGAFLESCPYEREFDATLSICISTADCDPEQCLTSPEYTVYPDYNDPYSFCLCRAQQPVVVGCPNGMIFNSELLLCTTVPVPSPNCNSTYCINQPDNTAFPALNTTDGFCVCDGRIPIYHDCPPNSAFDPILSICLQGEPIETVCQTVNCATSTEGTTFPASNTTSGFCVCLNTKGTYRPCPLNSEFNSTLLVCVQTPVDDCNSPCDSTHCAALPENTPYPAKDNVNGFCLCQNGSPIYKDCPANFEFQASLGVCLPLAESSCDTMDCDASQCLILAENAPFPALNTTNGFCVCKSGSPVYVNCLPDSEFQVEYGACIPNAGVPCGDSSCEPNQCSTLNQNSAYPASNTTNGFCLCRTNGPTFVPCPANLVFDATLSICLPVTEIPCGGDSSCDASQCLVQPDNAAFPAKNTTSGFCLCQNGNPIYKNCPPNSEFEASISACVPITNVPCGDSSCDSAYCLSKPNYTPYPAKNTTSGFCLCKDGGAIYGDCPPNTEFSANVGACQPMTSCQCDSTKCLTLGNNYAYPSSSSVNGFCVCENGIAIYKNCPADTQFDATLSICLAPEPGCNVTLCSQKQNSYPFPVAANDDANSFCLCSGPSTVTKLTCPVGNVFNAATAICENPNSSEIGEGCTCPGNIKEGDLVANPSDCQKYYVCQGGRLQEGNCGTNNYFNKNLSICEPDTNGACVPLSQCTCVGAYQEGQLLANPTNCQLYYICYQGKLQLNDCGTGNMFSSSSNGCVSRNSVVAGRSIGKQRAVMINDKQEIDDDMQQCIQDEKRSVSSNCTQYEICLDSKWLRRTCPDHRYYNKEQQKCLFPRDDTTCSYVKLMGIPPCNSSIESQTLPAGNEANQCNQYLRCNEGKWRLKTCPKRHFYARQLRTCIPMTTSTDQNNNCDNNVFNFKTNDSTSSMCQHRQVRPALTNSCSTFYMCLENEWWQQHCPLGMYFNQTHNYCMPNDGNHQCAADLMLDTLSEEQDLLKLKCTQGDNYRPSQMFCNRYFVCVAGKWLQQNCLTGHYFNATQTRCLLDIDDKCRLSLETKICKNNTRRSLSTNCNSYEHCLNNTWIRVTCPEEQQFDAVINECVPKNGTNDCMNSGARRACRFGEVRRFPLKENCTQFYYCEADNWKVGLCLKGHTYSQRLGSCVPHAVDNKCLPVWQEQITDPIIMPKESVKNHSCLGKPDGYAVPDYTNCTRFFKCLNETPAINQLCEIGSFFDIKLNKCRLNDGSCRLPLTGVCQNAKDNATIANPEDCRAYFTCSTINGTQLLYCPNGEFYHKETQQCRPDQGECRIKQQQPTATSKCSGLMHGTRIAHELYCNIYYACVRGLAIPVECPNNSHFNPIIGECLFDKKHKCQNGQLIDGINTTYSCGSNLDSKQYLPDRIDCTRYFVCSNGTAIPKRCSNDSYFDSEQSLCVEDDGTCPYVVDKKEKPNKEHVMIVPPDPKICENEEKQGFMMPDPMNCNNFYVCIQKKIRYEHCYEGYYFNVTLGQCQISNQVNETNFKVNESLQNTTTDLNPQQCLDQPTSLSDLCSNITDGSIAEPGDCRRYIKCTAEGPTSHRCRNGESYDGLLRICRQNDGTCLLENGERVGVCNKKHGQLTRHPDNCRSYFICLHGQRIEATCATDEYFNKTTNICQKDTLKQCNDNTNLTNSKPDDANRSLSCAGLKENTLYPLLSNRCRSYYQCINGQPKVQDCASGLYFDYATASCLTEIKQCAMPTKDLEGI